ncbi:PEP-CTERM sorting domain-containing protein [Sphaerotilus sp.]|uniref:PEP-CTERM sorting domain-containing protein n=1 Tax=Sphaerotilus sp. TaxID=2093942 RepID=UPI00286DA192|nr:PEP-CTERM sorting domain-containing protein [Sphaerotilus sp.]
MRKTLTAIAAGLLLAATGAHANLVTNGTFDSPDISTGSFSTVTSLSFSDLNWGFYSGGSGVTKLVDNGGNQFAQIASGDILYTSFSVATSGQYNIGFDFQGSGLWGLTGSSWSPEVVAPTYLTPSAGWTSATGGPVALVGGDSYKIYFGSMVTPPQFYSTLSLDNVSVSAVTPVPEPEGYAMMMAGLGALGLMSRRRMRKAA